MKTLGTTPSSRGLIKMAASFFRYMKRPWAGLHFLGEIPLLRIFTKRHAIEPKPNNTIVHLEEIWRILGWKLLHNKHEKMSHMQTTTICSSPTSNTHFQLFLPMQCQDYLLYKGWLKYIYILLMAHQYILANCGTATCSIFSGFYSQMLPLVAIAITASAVSILAGGQLKLN